MLQSPRLVRHCAWVIRHETLINFITIIIIIIVIVIVIVIIIIIIIIIIIGFPCGILPWFSLNCK